jgi:hypothetical protein
VSIINERTNKKITKEKCNITLKINNSAISDPLEVVNAFNDYFASIGKCTHLIGNNSATAVISPTQNTMYLSPVNIHEVHKILKNLKTKHSYGFYKLPPHLIKECAYQLAFPYTILINQSFEQGVFPTLLKQTVIKPVHKKQNKSDPNNYRPIALLSTSSKIYERAMYNRVIKFCEKYKIFDECQNEFRKDRSTVLGVYKSTPPSKKSVICYYGLFAVIVNSKFTYWNTPCQFFSEFL